MQTGRFIKFEICKVIAERSLEPTELQKLLEALILLTDHYCAFLLSLPAQQHTVTKYTDSLDGFI